MKVDHLEYARRCRQKWYGMALRDARANWHQWVELHDTLLDAMRLYLRNPGLVDLSGAYHNPSYSRDQFLWSLQENLQPGRGRLDPLLDFEEHFQKVFLRRGLRIYCDLLIEAIEREAAPDPAQLTIEEITREKKDTYLREV